MPYVHLTEWGDHLNDRPSTVWGWCFCGGYLHESEVPDHLADVHGVSLAAAEWVEVSA